MEISPFLQRFQAVLILACISGIYIPGVNHFFPGSHWYPLVIYFILFYTLSWYNFVDMLLVLLTNKLPFVTAFELIACMTMICWNSFSSLHFLIVRKKMEKLLETWNYLLQPSFHPELREGILKCEYVKVLRKCKRLLLFFVFPFGLANLACVILGELSTPSMLGHGSSRKANRFAILPQAGSYLCWFLTYSMYQTLFTLILRLLLAELLYLKAALQELLKNFDDCEKDRKILTTLIAYHSRVIGKEIQKLYTPPMLVEFFALTTFVCSLGYCATTGYMEVDVTLYAVFLVGVCCCMSSFTCGIGDEIMEAGLAFGDAAFYGVESALSIKNKSILGMIIKISYERLVIISPFGLFPLLSRTFYHLTYLQYRFFRFISDIRGH